MTDTELLDWIDTLPDFDLARVEDHDGTLLWEASADSVYTGLGASIRDAIRAAHAKMKAGAMDRNLTLHDAANLMRPALGLPRRPFRD